MSNQPEERSEGDRDAVPPPPQAAQEGACTATVQVLSFTLGGQRCGLKVADIYTVERMVTVTKIPDSPPDVLGVVNYRGTVIPIIDLSARFGLGACALTLNTPLVVAWTGRYAVGLVVKAVGEVLSIASEDIRSPEDFGQHPGCVAGVAKIADELLLILNTESLLSAELAEKVDLTQFI